MNSISLINFKNDIKQIQEYLQHIKHVEDILYYQITNEDNTDIKLLINTLKTHNQNFITDRRIFEYKAIIISLYGLLEKYIELWLKEYLNSLSLIIKDYNLIEEKIREKHFELSIKLIPYTSKEYAKFKGITKEMIVKKLNNCLENSLNFQFNHIVHNLIKICEPTDVAIEVLPKVKANYKFYIKK